MPKRRWSTVVVASSSSSPSITRTDASNARGTRVPAASSSPLTCTRPFPSPSTRVEVNRTCGCSSTSKKSADRRCLSRAEMPVSTLAASIVSSISGAGRPDDVRAVEPAEAAAHGVQAPEVLDLELDRRPGRIGRPPLDRLLRLGESAAHPVSFFVGSLRASRGRLPRGCRAAGGPLPRARSWPVRRRQLRRSSVERRERVGDEEAAARGEGDEGPALGYASGITESASVRACETVRAGSPLPA